MGVMRESAADLGLAPKGSAVIVIVRNLYRVKGLALRPARVCLKTAGPGLEKRTAIYRMSISGSRQMNANSDRIRSNNLFAIL